ncbi:MAG: SH3 domain-containing protein [Caldilineaceae bacterium]|nr:SH3 domain-containing protein [Caldilineaceae bacterium]
MNNRSRVPALPPPSSRRSPAVPLALLLLILVIAACGRRPTAPTPLPPGTPVAQPTPDFSAPAQPDSATRTADQTADQTAQSLRTRLAQETSLTPSPSPLTPAVTPVVALDPSLDVFNRPNALGILADGGILYAAPGGTARANLQVGATLTITGRSADGAWYAVYLADGTAGWAPAAQVRVFGDAAELETVQESLGPAVVATLIAQASQPQEPLSAVVARLTPTASAPASTATEPQPTAASEGTGPEITGPAVTVIVAGANLRAGPGTGYAVVGVLYQDDTAAVLGRNQAGDWLQLQSPDGPAWIFAPLVETTVAIADLPTVEAPANAGQ